MPYSLADVVTDLKLRVSWLSHAITHEPLSGLADGSNKLFYLPVAPGESGSLTVHDASGTVISALTVDYATGLVTFTTAPTDLVYGTYTALAMSDARLTAFIRDGFAEMQKRYLRTLYLIASGPDVVISSDPASAVEPVVGGLAFSVNDVQKRFWHLCTRYVMCEAALEDKALSAKMFRESGRITSLQIDETKMPQNIQAMLTALDASIERAAKAIAEQGGDTAYGDFIPGARSDEHVEGYDWWVGSKQYNGVVP